jgi:hypothetical protein
MLLLSCGLNEAVNWILKHTIKELRPILSLNGGIQTAVVCTLVSIRPRIKYLICTFVNIEIVFRSTQRLWNAIIACTIFGSLSCLDGASHFEIVQTHNSYLIFDRISVYYRNERWSKRILITWIAVACVLVSYSRYDFDLIVMILKK